MATWLLAAAIDTGDTALEETLVGLEVTAIGMAVVFAVLILLYYLMLALGRLVGERAAQPPSLVPVTLAMADDNVDGGAAVCAATNMGAAEAAEVEAQASGAELAAAISAALAAAMASGSRDAAPAATRHTRPDWALAGRIDQITARERLPRG